MTIESTYTGATYQTMSGTSMATPHVVGVAALIRSYHPTYTVDEVETALEITARDLGAPGRDDIFGNGRIQAAQAVAWMAPDVTPPTASLKSPLGGATNVGETVRPTVGFSENVNGADGSTISLATAAGAHVAAVVTYASATRRATIVPAAILASRTKYFVTIAAGIADLAGNPLSATSFSFTTGDHIAPTVTWVHPAHRSTGVSRWVSPRVVFSEKVTNISRDTVRLKNMRTGRSVAVVIHYDSATHGVTIDPSRVDICFGNLCVFKQGAPTRVSSEKAREPLRAKEVIIYIRVHQGKAQGLYWTCDFTGQYVDINARYRT